MIMFQYLCQVARVRIYSVYFWLFLTVIFQHFMHQNYHISRIKLRFKWYPSRVYLESFCKSQTWYKHTHSLPLNSVHTHVPPDTLYDKYSNVKKMKATEDAMVSFVVFGNWVSLGWELAGTSWDGNDINNRTSYKNNPMIMIQT